MGYNISSVFLLLAWDGGYKKGSSNLWARDDELAKWPNERSHDPNIGQVVTTTFWLKGSRKPIFQKKVTNAELPGTRWFKVEVT